MEQKSTRELYREWLQDGMWGSYSLAKKKGYRKDKLEKVLKAFEGKQIKRQEKERDIRKV